MRATATITAAAGAGGGVSGAAEMPAQNLILVSSDGATKGVKLPLNQQGDWCIVINTSATACNLFAKAGGTINGGSTDAGCAIPASKGVICSCVDNDTWKVHDLTALAGAAS